MVLVYVFFPLAVHNSRTLLLKEHRSKSINDPTMTSRSENHRSIIDTSPDLLGIGAVRKDGHKEQMEETSYTKSTELMELAKKSSNSCFRRISSGSAAESQSRADSASNAWQCYSTMPSSPSGDAIEDAAGGTIATPVANPSHDIRALAELYHSSRRSRNSVFASQDSECMPSLRSLVSSSSSSGSQQIWNEMRDAIRSTEIDEWAFTVTSPICKSFSTNSLSSMESDGAKEIEAVTAGELFDEDFFDRH
jgi:hypothetical protein